MGVDIVDLTRFADSLERTPGLRERLFTPGERGLPLASLAATFAAKEAVSKALGVPRELGWQDVEVTHDPDGRPVLVVRREPHDALSWHLSLSHDAGAAIAMVVAESRP